MARANDRSPQLAGRSAQREYERRHVARRQRAKTRYGTLGTLLTNLMPDPMEIQGWQQGAGAEIATARELDRLLRRTNVIVLHDRRIPGRGRANIDHIAIGPGGITVIDTKSSRGQVQLTTKGILNKRELLLVNGRDRTRQLDALERQINAVASRLARYDLDGVGIVGALCYPYMHRPFLHNSRARNGLATIDNPRHIARVAKRPGPLGHAQIDRLVETLAVAFPPASAVDEST